MPERDLSIGRQRALTLAIAVFGTGAFWLTGLPLPFLFGPMLACLVAALSGMHLTGFGQLSVAARTILGVAIGASITPELLVRLPQIALSIALIPFFIAIIGLIGVPFFRKVYKFDMITSWYAAMPGGLQDIVVFGQEAGADVRALSLIHATRVLVIVSLAPIILTKGFGVSLDQPIGASAATLPVQELVLMVFAAFVGWKGAAKVGLFGASILGPMILTAIFSLTGLINARPPSEALVAAQFLIGVGIGVGYVGVTFPELRRDVLAGALFVLILAALAAVFAELTYLLGLAPPVESFLAFAPGGQAEMTVLAIVAGADLGFVIAHHITRVVVVITGAPLAARFFRLGDPAGKGGKGGKGGTGGGDDPP